MSERRNRIRSKNRTLAYIAAGVVHALIIAAMVFNITSKPKALDGAYSEKVAVVKAALVEDKQIKKRREKIKNDELEKKLQKQRDLDRLKKKKLLDAKKKKDLAEAQAKRKAIDLKKKKELEEKEKAKKEKERKEKLKKERADEEKRKKAKEEERMQKEEEEERRRMLDESMRAEEVFLAEQRAKERSTTLRAKYSALIQQKVDGVRRIDPNFERWRVAVVNIKLSPLGEVLSVRIVKSSGSELYDRSVETAILKSSPLPIPTVSEDANVHNLFRDIIYEFPMPGA